MTMNRGFILIEYLLIPQRIIVDCPVIPVGLFSLYCFMYSYLLPLKKIRGSHFYKSWSEKDSGTPSWAHTVRAWHINKRSTKEG